MKKLTHKDSIKQDTANIRKSMESLANLYKANDAVFGHMFEVESRFIREYLTDIDKEAKELDRMKKE